MLHSLSMTGDGTQPLDRRSMPRPPVSAIIRVDGASPPIHRLAAGLCVVGSGSGCDIVIDDPTVSRQHLELALVAEGVAVRDLGSRNGTHFHGQHIDRMTVALGTSLTIGRVTVNVELDREAFEEPDDDVGDGYCGIFGRSAAMRQLFARLRRLEGSLVPVLIEGESGVGQELVARAIHRSSPRSNGPFVALNCGALPRELVGSELFGHRRGAFTGANETRKGAFETAEGGTLFLDELGELPLDVQPVLLRALEYGEIRAVGSDDVRTVKTRVVCATNRALQDDVRSGRFREDLYYRVAVVRLRVPPLREHLDDVPMLAERFAADHGIELDPDVLVRLSGRTWPGNVRELRSAIMAYAALGELGEPAEPEHGALEKAVSTSVDLNAPYTQQKDAVVDAFSRVYLRALMARAAGNQTDAARMADLDRTYLGRLLAKYGFRGDG